MPVPVPADLCVGNSERYALELPSAERSGRNAVALSASVNGIYLSRANLDVALTTAADR